MEKSPGSTEKPEDSSARRRRAAKFYARLASSLVLWGVVIAGLVLANAYIIFAVTAGLAGLSLFEFFQMQDGRNKPLRAWVILISTAYFAALFWVCGHLGSPLAGFLDSLTFTALLFGVFVSQMAGKIRERETLFQIATSLLGFVYIIFFFGFVLRIAYLPGAEGHTVKGGLLLFYLLLVTKFTDMGAYLTGSVFGKHKMIPHISPGKTWEGFAGSIVFALGASLAMVAIFGRMEGMALLTWGHAAILGVLLAITASIGDLAESTLKRSLDVKDSGNLLPGIGGALDLIDSICFTAPVFYFYAKIVLL